MLVKLNNATIDLDPESLLECMSAADAEAFARNAAKFCPVGALNEALDTLRSSDSATSLHATLDALDAIRRDLAEWLVTGQVWEDRDGQARGERSLTDEERARICEGANLILVPEPTFREERRW